jgi:hypothetical protein
MSEQHKLIDFNILNIVEDNASVLAESLNSLIESHRLKFVEIQNCSKEYVNIYKEASEGVSLGLEKSMKNAVELITKCDELNGYIHPIYILTEQVKQIKDLLDALESKI